MKRTSLKCIAGRGIPAVLALVAASAFLLSSGHQTSAQEANRQLVQTGVTNITATSKRIALVIGNGAYTNAPALKNPPNDARDMAANLKTLGFEVSSGVNVSQREMKRLIREFGQKLKAGGSGLFYYAGHGVQARGHNYIIPVDAEIQSEADVEDSGVDVGLVLNYMDDAQNGLNIVILDACRNNPFSRSFRSASDGLAQVDAPTGTLIAYATAPGRVAADGAGENGLYTSELLKAMRLPGLTATDMFMQVRSEVMKKTGNKQVPWESSSLVGAFYFTGGRANSSSVSSVPNDSAPTETKFDAAAFEYNYWDSIKTSTNIDDFKAYLSKYPNGQFADLAKNRINTFVATAKPVEVKPAATENNSTELVFWDAIKSSSSPEDFQAYLKKYPNGSFTELATNRLRSVAAARREKERTEEARKAAEEIEKQTKTFKISYGYKFSLGENFWGATLKVTPEKFEMVADDGTNIGWNCASFATAAVDNNFVREILCGIGKCRIKAASASEATNVLSSVRAVCSGQQKALQDTEANARSYLALVAGRTEPIASLGVLTADTKSNRDARIRVGNVVGAVVLAVAAGSAAERAGLKQDDVITAVGGSPVSDSMSLIQVLLHTSVDTEVEITILRDGLEQTVRARPVAVSMADWQSRQQGALGISLFKQEKWADAELALKEAVRLKSDVAEYQNYLGAALEVQKKFAEAQIHYQEAVRLKPSETLYQDNLRRMQKAKK
jgi:tetratricopeptide (TPR) repeat protein